MFTRTFWLAVLERVTGAVLVSLATSVADTGNVVTVDWPTALGVAGAAAVASLAAAVGKSQVGTPGTPNLIDAHHGRHTRT